MSRHPRPLPAGLSDVFRTADARALGVTAGRLDARDLERPYRGVRRRAATTEAVGYPAKDAGPYVLDRAARATTSARVRAHALVLPEHGFYLGAAACALYGLPVLNPHDAAIADLEVGVLAPHRALRRPGIDARQVRPDFVRVRRVEGIAVASPASTWALMGRTHSVRDLVVIGDAIVCIPRDDRGRSRPEMQLATPAQLRAALEVGRRRGAERLREALALVRIGSMSPLETDFRLGLVAAGLPEPVLDHEVRDSSGTRLGISDGAYPVLRIALEVEGDHHRSRRAQWNRDIEKYAAYSTVDWEAVRVTSTHVRGRDARAPQMVRAALLRRGWMP